MKRYVLCILTLMLAACSEQQPVHPVIEVLNAMTPVKDQGKSQSCWIYAMLAAIETEHIGRGDSVNLSPAWIEQKMKQEPQMSASGRGMGATLLALIQKYGVVGYDAMRSTDAPAPTRVFMLGVEYTPATFYQVIGGVLLILATLMVDETVMSKLGYEDLQFLVGNIADYDESAKADMVVTLHACDTATDFALQKARRWNAKVILSVPCCQHELNRQIRRPDMDAILGHGILRERFSAILTDALRADKLTEWGYKVDMIEFTSLEHTAKNIMLRCIAGKASPADRRKAQADFAKQCAYWHVSPTIGKE